MSAFRSKRAGLEVGPFDRKVADSRRARRPSKLNTWVARHARDLDSKLEATYRTSVEPAAREIERLERRWREREDDMPKTASNACMAENMLREMEETVLQAELELAAAAEAAVAAAAHTAVVAAAAATATAAMEAAAAE